MGEHALTDADRGALRRWAELHTERHVSQAVATVLDERDALAAEVATCHRLIARAQNGESLVLTGNGTWIAVKSFGGGGSGSGPVAPDEARVLDTVRAGGDEEKATREADRHV